MYGRTASWNIGFSRCVAAIAVAIAASASLTAFGAEDPENYTITGFKFFSASPGETNVYSGVLSGTGYAIVEGGGTVAFSNPNNTYSGGTLVSNAVFRLDADGCAGSGAITAAVNKAHIFMNCANVPNNLYFAAGYNNSSPRTTMKTGEYPPDGDFPLFPLVSSVTVSGKVYFNKNSKYIPGSSKISDSRTVTFENDVSTASSAELSLYAYGTTTFNGKLTESATTANISIGGASSAKGSVVFNTSSNSVKKIATYNANFTLNARDALPETLFYFCYGANGYAKFNLNGNDQTFAGVIWRYGSSHPSPPENDSGFRFRTTEGHPATVRFTGSNTYTPNGGTTPYKNRLALSGPLTLVMDILPASTKNGFYQEFSVRKSETTGDLVISNGDFRVTEGATFPNVPNIYVGMGGIFSSSGTTNAFAGCRSLVLDGTMTFADDVKTPFAFDKMALSLGASAHLTLPIGSTLTVVSLNVGGGPMPEGTYGDGGIPVGQIAQGTVVVRGHDRYVDCVNGDDANPGTASLPKATIRAATTNAVSGDVIHVAPGTYADAEGVQMLSATGTSGFRVIVPEGVTLIGTEGAEKTLIIGANASSENIDNETYGTGSDGVRCVCASNGVTVCGFTLTGGRGAGGSSGSNASAAFYSPTALGATIEDCIVSNNVAYNWTINQAVVRRCRVIKNVAIRNDRTDGAAGHACSWQGCIIAGNKGNSTASNASRIESCTFGTNTKLDGSSSPQTLFNNSGNIVVNSLFTYYNDRWQGTVYATNCIFACNERSGLSAANCSNCLFNTSVSLTNYKPNPGSKVIDAGNNALVSGGVEGAKDILGTPRVLNANIDIGAVEYDWRPTFAERVDRRLTFTDVSPSVTTNAAGGVKIPSGALAGTVAVDGTYSFTFEISGGTLEAFVGGVSAGVYSEAGEQTIRLEIPDAATEFRFVFTPDAETPGAAVLKKISSNKGFVITYR